MRTKPIQYGLAPQNSWFCCSGRMTIQAWRHSMTSWQPALDRIFSPFSLAVRPVSQYKEEMEVSTRFSNEQKIKVVPWWDARSKCLQAHQKLLCLQVAAQIPLYTHHMSVNDMIFISLTSTFQGQRKLLQGQCPKRRLPAEFQHKKSSNRSDFQRWICSIPGTVGVLWLMMGQDLHRRLRWLPLQRNFRHWVAALRSVLELVGEAVRWKLGYTFYIMRSTLIEHCKSLDPYDSVQSLITIWAKALVEHFPWAVFLCA